MTTSILTRHILLNTVCDASNNNFGKKPERFAVTTRGGSFGVDMDGNYNSCVRPGLPETTHTELQPFHSARVYRESLTRSKGKSESLFTDFMRQSKILQIDLTNNGHMNPEHDHTIYFAEGPLANGIPWIPPFKST
jgi:hypothetical protein